MMTSAVNPSSSGDSGENLAPRLRLARHRASGCGEQGDRKLETVRSGHRPEQFAQERRFSFRSGSRRGSGSSEHRSSTRTKLAEKGTR